MANYTLSVKEEESAKAFKEKHKECRRHGAPFSYVFEPNGIGIAVSIRCPYCKEEEDITDFDCW